MPRIQLLPDHLVSQIAAGEVVERPASVVKELVENALDAGAGEVKVELESGGKRRIVVEDDGSGMGRDDALLALDRHATSKIASFEDLERVASLGFRGEALASIAAVARVELETAEAPGEGHRVRIEGGRVRGAEPVARPRGTRIDVGSLFFNVPARRKFLKAPQTELRRALEVVQGYALARPEVRFSLASEGRALLDSLAAAGDGATAEAVRERVAQIFGRGFARQLVAIPEAGSGAPPAAPPAAAAASGPPVGERSGERIWGLVGEPGTARGRRTFVFVNRRLLRDRAVLAAFYRAVREEWRSDEFPALFLFLDVPPEEVDVNVHPQKAEVRFRDPRLVDRIHLALRRALEHARGEEAAPLRAPQGRPAAPMAWQGLGERAPQPRYPWPVKPGGEAGGGAWEVREAPAVYDAGPDPRHQEPGAGPGSGAGAGAPSPDPAFDPPPGRVATPAFAPLERAAVPLTGRSGEARPFRLLGQYKGTLILMEGPDGLYLVDQHVAHERILFERLRGALAGQSTPSQALLTPLVMEVSAAERMRLEELAHGLEEHGFGLAPLSGNSVALTALPAALPPDQGEDLVRALAAEDGDGEGGPEGLSLRILEALAASLACKAAVKMHHPLSAPEMEALMAELFQAENPYACPHGRPIVLQMTDSDLERRFGRR
ncbi:MAG TPA: DNA mismatch repair endonuclease MutL [Thermoanaerobaculia bacterium]|nr:DNA mismatch repair endonuclease MutL [Thermoanaerobaculia bacterium]